jgi:hypothetical protein
MRVIEIGDDILRVGAIEPLGDNPPRIHCFGLRFGRLVRLVSGPPPVVSTGESADEDLEPSEPTIDLGLPK